jgi:hypothetical protein
MFEAGADRARPELAGSFYVAVDGGEVLKFMGDAVFDLSHRARRAKRTDLRTTSGAQLGGLLRY